MGRDSKYETHVEPFLNDISRWKATMTEKQIAGLLGISYSSLQEYKKEHQELLDALRFGNKKMCDEVESSMFKLALGYYIDDFKVVVNKLTGEAEVVKYPRYIQPSPKAAELIWKRNDPHHHDDDALNTSIKKEELKLKKKKDKREEEDHW